MAFSLKALLGMDAKPFERGMDRAKRKVNNASKSMMASLAPILGFVGFTRLATSAVEMGSRISDLATQLRIGTDELQALQFAAQEAGVKSETLERALRNVQIRSQQAADGNKSYADALARLGVNTQDLMAMPLEQKLETIAKAAATAENGSEAFADVARILGERAGPELQEVLDKLARDGFPALADSARDAGQIMDAELIEKMDRMSDAVDRNKKRLTIMSSEVLVRIVPALQILGNGLGFVGDIVGIAAANVLAFGKALGSVVSTVVSPAISAMEGLGLAIKAAGQAAVRDFEGAADSIGKSKDAFADVKDEIMAIPGELKATADAVKTQIESGLDVFYDSLDRRNKEIKQSFGEIVGAGKEAAKAVAGADGSGAGSGTAGGAATGGGKTSKDAEDLRLKRLKLEALKAEVRGEKELAAELRRRIELAEKMERIMRDTNATRAEALIIAKHQMDADKEAEEAASSVSGKGIQTGKIGSAANIGSGPSADFIRRERENGLFDTTLGRTSPALLGDVAGAAEAKDEAPAKLDRVAEILETIERELTAESGAKKD